MLDDKSRFSTVQHWALSVEGSAFLRSQLDHEQEHEHDYE
jgi:hypothetical protein